jgi:hypothetical protein
MVRFSEDRFLPTVIAYVDEEIVGFPRNVFKVLTTEF